MSYADAQFSALECAFVDAAITPSLWQDALRALGDFTGSARGQLIGIGGPATIPFNWVTDMPQQAFDDFLTIQAGSPEISFRVAAAVRAGLAPGGNAPLSEYAYDEAMPTLATDVYRDYCETYDLPYGIQANVHVDRDGLIGLAVLRTQKDGRSSADQQDRFARAVPLAQRAVRIQAALEGAGAALVAGAFEAMDKAAILLDARGQVRAVTPRAEAVLGEGRWLRLVDRTLVPSRPEERDGFAAMLGLALRSGADARAHVVSSARSAVRPIIVDFITLPPREWALGFQPRVAVLVRCAALPVPAACLLEQIYGLSAAEAGVAALLATGLSRGEIADARGVSVATVISQIKRIFEKTGYSRESTLIAKLRDLAG